MSESACYLRNLSAAYRRRASRKLTDAERIADADVMRAKRLTDSAERLVVAADTCERLARAERRAA